SQPYISPDSGRWVIGIATPIVLPTGDHAGILHFEIPIQRFIDQLAKTPVGGSGYSVILDASGRLLSGPRLAEFRTAQGLTTDPDTALFPVATESGSLSWRAAVGTMITGAGSVEFNEDGVTYRAAYQPIEG